MDYHIDAKNKILGRLASEIAVMLQGKKNPKYEPRLAGGNRVFVKNYKNVIVTGKKLKNRVYYRHTGYMGHLKEQTLGERFQKYPKRAIQEVVRKMLPKNSLNAKRLKNLIFVE